MHCAGLLLPLRRATSISRVEVEEEVRLWSSWLWLWIVDAQESFRNHHPKLPTRGRVTMTMPWYEYTSVCAKTDEQYRHPRVAQQCHEATGGPCCHCCAEASVAVPGTHTHPRQSAGLALCWPPAQPRFCKYQPALVDSQHGILKIAAPRLIIESNTVIKMVDMACSCHHGSSPVADMSRVFAGTERVPTCEQFERCGVPCWVPYGVVTVWRRKWVVPSTEVSGKQSGVA